jgi:arsenate reductase
MGLDIAGQYVKSLMGYWGGKFNFTYLIVVCDRAEQECPLFPFSTYRLYWPFEDPSAAHGSDEEKLERFRAVRDQIAAKVRGWLRELEAKHILPSTTSTQ